MSHCSGPGTLLLHSTPLHVSFFLGKTRFPFSVCQITLSCPTWGPAQVPPFPEALYPQQPTCLSGQAPRLCPGPAELSLPQGAPLLPFALRPMEGLAHMWLVTGAEPGWDEVSGNHERVSSPLEGVGSMAQGMHAFHFPFRSLESEWDCRPLSPAGT